MAENPMKTCWKCNRIYEKGSGGLGLCPHCLNQIGTPVVVAVSIAAADALKK